MKVARPLIMILGLIVACVLWFLDSVFWQPNRHRDAYARDWSLRLGGITNPAAIPAEWKDSVYLRQLNDLEWVIAAMHHGSCCSVSEPWDCSVLLDSTGKLTVLKTWAPCAGSISDLGEFWTELVPAKTLAELYVNQTSFDH